MKWNIGEMPQFRPKIFVYLPRPGKLFLDKPANTGVGQVSKKDRKKIDILRPPGRHTNPKKIPRILWSEAWKKCSLRKCVLFEKKCENSQKKRLIKGRRQAPVRTGGDMEGRGQFLGRTVPGWWAVLPIAQFWRPLSHQAKRNHQMPAMATGVHGLWRTQRRLMGFINQPAHTYGIFEQFVQHIHKDRGF